jgi:hypothetical protein
MEVFLQKNLRSAIKFFREGPGDVSGKKNRDERQLVPAFPGISYEESL